MLLGKENQNAELEQLVQEVDVISNDFSQYLTYLMQRQRLINYIMVEDPALKN